MGSSFFPSLRRPDQQTYVSPPVSCVWNSSLMNEPLKLKAPRSSESSPNTKHATQHHIPEDLTLNRTDVATPNLTMHTNVHVRCSTNNHLQFTQRSTNFPKILVAVPKFYTLEVWHKASSILRTQNPGVTCGPHCYLVLCVLNTCETIHISVPRWVGGRQNYVEKKKTSSFKHVA